MDASSKWYKPFESLIRLYLGYVGPKEQLEETDKTLIFEDDIMCAREFYYSGYPFRKFVIDNFSGIREKVNDSTAFAILDQICHELLEKIKQREGVIKQTLDKYLTDDDVKTSAESLERILTTIKDKYKVILITDLVYLKDIDSVKIGNVLLRGIDEDYISKWPESWDKAKGSRLAMSLLGLGSSKYHSRSKFYDDNKDNCALEVTVDGFHLGEERSAAFESALGEFKRVFAYLFLCEYFLSHVREGKYEVETKELPFADPFSMTGPRGAQHYFICKLKDTNYFQAVDMRWEPVTLSRRTFIITASLFKELENRCCLDKFNEVFQSDNLGEIRNKISRCLDWYLKAELESDLTDIALSLFISLEALLSPGGDPLMSQTDDMAENVAIMVQSNVDDRYKWKKNFKKRYGLRNRIAHHGAVLEHTKHWAMVRDLKTDTVWSFRGILSRLVEILKYGNKTEAMKEYFEREKLKG